MIKDKRKLSLILFYLALLACLQGRGSCQSGSGSQTGTGSQSGGTGGTKGGAGNSAPGSGNGSGANGSAGSGGASAGFSIESEVVAYKSLESDSEAIGCDIFLALGVAGAAQDTKCPFSAARAENIKILVGSPTMFSSFQQWQAAMTIARLLLLRVNSLDKSCSNVSSAAGGRGGIAPTDAMNAVQQGISILQSTLGLFATNESFAGTTGTIQDQALVNAVARQLSVAGMQVIAPDLYPPNLLEMGDGSLVLNRLMLLLTARDCLQKVADTNAQTIAADKQAMTTGKIGNTPISDAEKKQRQDDVPIRTAKQDQMTGAITAIDQFIASLSAPTSSSVSQNPGSDTQNSNSSAANNPAQSPGSPAGKVNSSSGTNLLPNTGTPLMANLLAADEIAQALQFRGSWVEKQSYIAGDMVTRNRKSYEALVDIDSAHWKQSAWYVLSLKALESGGGVMNRSNLFRGTRVYFSGGAIATYGLFQIDGKFVCSANVYDYDGYIRDKEFQKKLRTDDITPSTQAILVRNPGCKPKK
jgi:hypothetical protein